VGNGSVPKSLFSELGKLHAQALAGSKSAAKPDEGVERRLEALTEQVERLADSRQFSGGGDARSFEAMVSAAIADARTCRAALQPVSTFVLDEGALATYLETLGTSSGASRAIVAEVGPALTYRLDTLTRPRRGR